MLSVDFGLTFVLAKLQKRRRAWFGTFKLEFHGTDIDTDTDTDIRDAPIV